ncbi:MAG: hypothetical protein JWR08_67 [Enterovirga sp.]|nr:hypothetical protein [Enterovirga sp.]
MNGVPRLLLAAAVASGLLIPAARAQDGMSAADRATLAACLSAAQGGRRTPETCIGAVQGPCMKQPGGETTSGMKACGGREIAAWDERLNAAYRSALAGDLGTQAAVRGGGSRTLTGADILRDAQRAWIAFRDRKCDAAGLPMEGGSGAGLQSVECHLGETARQAIFLDGLKAREP